jgi:hypothetical protein
MPVRAADKSVIVLFFFITFWKAHSKKTHEAAQTPVTRTERQPNTQIEIMKAGQRAIITSSIMRFVVTLSFI